MKIELDYDPSTGNITDGSVHIMSYGGLEHREVKTPKIVTDDLIALKKAGFTNEEIIQLKREDML